MTGWQAGWLPSHLAARLADWLAGCSDSVVQGILRQTLGALPAQSANSILRVISV